ncbi:hypothetical protein [Neomoorella mulderi]|uniref:hypothetical protein n=1 Tax=Neomoorella mulderi TaxID=202604 RepID=UPI001372BAD8|nr:hypothetical protein [Moorella mulderi]
MAWPETASSTKAREAARKRAERALADLDEDPSLAGVEMEEKVRAALKARRGEEERKRKEQEKGNERKNAIMDIIARYKTALGVEIRYSENEYRDEDGDKEDKKIAVAASDDHIAAVATVELGVEITPDEVGRIRRSMGLVVSPSFLPPSPPGSKKRYNSTNTHKKTYRRLAISTHDMVTRGAKSVYICIPGIWDADKGTWVRRECWKPLVKQPGLSTYYPTLIDPAMGSSGGGKRKKGGGWSRDSEQFQKLN